MEELYRYRKVPSWIASKRCVTRNVRLFHALVQFGPLRVTTWVANVHVSPTSQVGRSEDVRALGRGAGGAAVGRRRARGRAREKTIRTAPHLATFVAKRLQIKGLLVLFRNPATRGKL